MKCTPLKRKSKSDFKKLEDKVWAECKRIIRKRYPNTCYTCGRTGLEGANWHTGHMIAKASLGASMKYSLDILRPQCYHCNINLGGMGAVFAERMRKELGEKKYKELYQRCLDSRNNFTKASDHYTGLLKEYLSTDK